MEQAPILRPILVVGIGIDESQGQVLLVLHLSSQPPDLAGHCVMRILIGEGKFEFGEPAIDALAVGAIGLREAVVQVYAAGATFPV